MRAVETGVLEVELHEDGPADGQPVLLLHGWPDAPRGRGRVAGRLHERAGARSLHRCAAAAPPASVRKTRLATGARAAYTLAAVAPQRITAIVALALPYQPYGSFSVPPFPQARAFWYQWFMCVDAGARAVAADPIDFARAAAP